MPIIPNNPGVGVYMQSLAAFVELGFKLAGGYGSREQVIDGSENMSIIAQITEAVDTVLKKNIYDAFYTQFKGTLEGLNIRYKEYKGTQAEKEWLDNIVEDSADLLGLIKQQLETEMQNEHEHTVITLGIYADVCLFRATVMSERKHTYQIDRDAEVKNMLQECKGKLDNVIEKVQNIYNKKKKEADECVDPIPNPGALVLFTCSMFKDAAEKVSTILKNLQKQKENIESAISVIRI
ncbi:hypothetical protein CN448_32025 [Bacillus cereus]|uniref:hypothetical protein n=1 Tax=Bacillus cereus TaxID=1396 RepID=UPI000BF6B66A|nr:hypothetical protein [Bacillus cereus]PEW56833.1 hypothetical protein CN448_32025 [Bacillus cereus]